MGSWPLVWERLHNSVSHGQYAVVESQPGRGEAVALPSPGFMDESRAAVICNTVSLTGSTF